MRFGGKSGGTAQNITYISGGGGGGGATSLQLLWENSDPTATFAAQTITIDLSTYGAVFIKTLNDRTSQTPQYHTELVFVGDSSVCYSSNASTTSYTYKRQADASTSGITFGNGYRNTTAGSGYAIPVKVYGIGTGETPVPEDPLNTFTGAIVQFNATKAKPIQSIVGTVVASQSYNGYTKPWAGGKGKNLFGGTYNVRFYFDTPIVSGTTISISGSVPLSGNTRVNLYNQAGTRYYNAGMNTLSDGRKLRNNITLTQDTYSILFDVAEATDFQVEVGSTNTAYEPYANICPITGLTEANIFLEAAYDAGATPKRTVSFGQTVYGGDYTVAADGSVSIELTDAEIASYAGETLPSTWLSDRDEYAVGTTPTTGAQVVYKLASPTTVTATSITALTSLVGNNAIWADTGDITVTAYGT